MTSTSPIETLIEHAERALEEALIQLGACRSAHASAVAQMNQLIGYEQDYRKQLEENMTRIGLNVDKLINYQYFISSLYKIVSYHSQQVSVFQSQVDLAMAHWQRKKQRLNAFEILKMRSDTARQLRKSRRNQKQMDEFALGASLRRVES
ncbi:hypothetical protein BG74_04315 [Sodalis-like endosymbiont of Proechinophthirus fluctus]|uniref:flagellar export protein FliJ n=1 Tax=Sodalis-like endosymbiont of Proechinophthirus fluctus TaxID=1462730 RepID=UPI0007A81087|nr:flagellar export protein FliJ [Sodalis-like endosymbiont of Proechinophthirus fluctus]KYP97210.1 hypothetical protein BG74_04315 [Sodalis-like endosymbiont of Proechinophthirus fluctus]